MPPPSPSSGTVTPAGYTSTMTAASERDIEAQASPTSNRVSYFRHITDQAGVTQSVIDFHYPGKGSAESPFVIDFLPGDTYNPLTFSERQKWLITGVQAIATLAISFASSAYSGGVREILTDFGVSQEVAILGVSLFVFSFALGALVWAPLSEVVGRQRLFFVSYMALTAFNAGAAGALSRGVLGPCC
ncbi:hypothetical protein NLG97_g3026 [Lecanicillium saksenae]|uniref:Uncharacterized protein n=1 Tax=Lecanicillium saksenae TaxID=468837 RepID=A0ACC1R2M2_9HYPO|nr:hypothetical protein NLG97_g3026 [Lecanicillium saksenae]